MFDRAKYLDIVTRYRAVFNYGRQHARCPTVTEGRLTLLRAIGSTWLSCACPLPAGLSLDLSSAEYAYLAEHGLCAEVD